MNLHQPTTANFKWMEEFYREREQQVKCWQSELNQRLDLSFLMRAELSDLDERSQQLLRNLDENESKITMLQNLIDG